MPFPYSEEHPRPKESLGEYYKSLRFLKSSHDLVQSEHKARSFYRIGMASDDDDVVPRFTIDSETDRQYSRFNARGTEITVRLLPPAIGDNQDAITHFQASVNDLFDY